MSEISIGITLEDYEKAYEKCSKNGNYYDLYTGEIICINYAFKTLNMANTFSILLKYIIYSKMISYFKLILS